MNNDVLKIENTGPVVRVTFTRPDVHNALNEHLLSALRESFERLSADPAVRVIVLGGEGKSFSAGADLHWMGQMAGYTREENRADAEAARAAFAAVANCPKVTIARVHGAAMGGGSGLVAACDLSIAAESAIFAFSEVRLGIIPAIISPFVIQKIGIGAARALFVTGRRFGAAEALRLGLVQEVVPDSELATALERTVADALLAGPEAVLSVKRLLTSIAGKSPAEVAAETVAAIAEARVSPEGQEGIRAFLEKRKPEWQQ